MRGAGRAFCAGLDIKERSGSNSGDDPFGGASGFRAFWRTSTSRCGAARSRSCALVHGAACGGGFAFALAADIRIAGESAKMNAAFIKLGLSSCDMGVSYFLPRLVGRIGCFGTRCSRGASSMRRARWQRAW